MGATEDPREQVGSRPPRPEEMPLPKERSRPKGRFLLGLGVGAFAALWASGFILYATHEHPGGFIGDDNFRSEASGICEQAQAEMPSPAAAGASLEERAGVVEKVHQVLTRMVDSLESLPVADEDSASVSVWIGYWRQSLSVAPEYVAAIRSGEKDRIAEVGNLGDQPSSDANEFARNNEMEACVF